MITKPWTIEQILNATGGELAAGPAAAEFAGISIDSRQISGNELFVAVKGATHDGHAFVPEISDKGIRGIVINRHQFSKMVRDRISPGVSCVLVDDTTKALGDLAAFHLRRFPIPMVCITGSNGKTTTKEMTALVLGEKFNTLKTAGNLNNEFGVPLTLFCLNSSHEAAVIELGMNHPGEIRRLSEICRPDIGVITNVGPAHLEGLGSVNAVMAAKGELIENLKPDGIIILNGDDDHCRQLGKASLRKVIFYGQSADADVRATEIADIENTTTFTLRLPEENCVITISAPGRFMVSNALAAAAVGHLNGLNARQIKSGIEKFRPVSGRMDIKKSRKGFFIIDDSYNANPGSMKAAITTLASVKGNQKGALVAGDMLELGGQAELLHEQIGAFAACSGVNRLFLTGKYAASFKKGAQQQGMAEEDIIIGDKFELVKSLVQYLGPQDWVVVKGSRSAKMDEIVAQLEAKDASAA